MKLYTHTPLAKATFRIFKKIRHSLQARHPDIADGFLRAVIFGGVAVHFYTKSRMTTDLNIDLYHDEKFDNLMQESYETSSGCFDSLRLGKSGMINLCPLHENYCDDAVALDFNTPPMNLFLISPIDLAVSKVGRFSNLDQTDIIALAKKNLLDESHFLQRASDALSNWIGNQDFIRHNIDDTALIIRKYT